MTDTIVKLPVWDSITEAWHKSFGAKGTIWGALLVVIAISIGIKIIGGIAGMISPALMGFVTIIGQIISSLLMAGIIYIGLQRAQDSPISYQMVFHTLDWSLGFRVILLYILKLLILLPFALVILIVGFFNVLLNIMTVGISHANEVVTNSTVSSGFSGGTVSIIVCIIVGCAYIYTITRMMLALPALLQKNTGSWQAIVLSFRATRGNFWRLVEWYILLSLIFMVSILLVGIGLIWTIPLAYISFGIVYKTLSANIN